MVRQNDRDVVNLPYTLVCSLTYMRLRHSVIKPAFELRAVIYLSHFKGKQTTISQLKRRNLNLF